MRRSNALYVGVLNGEGVIMQLCSTITSSNDTSSPRDVATRAALSQFLPAQSVVTINPTSRAVGWWVAAAGASDAPAVIAQLQSNQPALLTPDELLDFLVWSSSLPEWDDQPVIILPAVLE